MKHLHIKTHHQTLILYEGESACAQYSISSAYNGLGEEEGSFQTPRGHFHIHACIGAEAPINSVFVGREPTGEIYTEELGKRQPERDWILTRILWLAGDEPGHNLGGKVDTLSRMIYLHGCPDSAPMGTPRSHGCIRMRNTDIIHLFSEVVPGTPVFIEA